MSSLGNDAYAGTLHCNKLIANNTTNPHLITGDLEITGDLKIDGGLEVDSAGFKGVKLNSNPSVNQVDIDLNDNTQTWTISADAGSSQLSFSHIINGAGSGVLVAGLTYNAGALGVYLPGLIRLQGIPTSAAGLPAESVWSNSGVLNITPP